MREVAAIVAPFLLAGLLVALCAPRARAGVERYCPLADCVQYERFTERGPCLGGELDAEGNPRGLWFSDGTRGCYAGARAPVVVDPDTLERWTVDGGWIACRELRRLCPWTAR